ncbi:MAG: hypothetical protein AAGG07_03895 [Planctomycetota bacterium]
MQTRSIRYQIDELKLTRAELEAATAAAEVTAKANKELAATQARTLSAQVLLPLMDENRSDEQGEARRHLATFFDGSVALQEFSHWHQAVMDGKHLGDFASQYHSLERSRRTVKKLIVKMYGLYDAGIVSDNSLARMVISKTTVQLARDVLVPLERIIDEADRGAEWVPPWAVWLDSLYQEPHEGGLG